MICAAHAKHSETLLRSAVRQHLSDRSAKLAGAGDGVFKSEIISHPVSKIGTAMRKETKPVSLLMMPVIAGRGRAVKSLTRDS
jgi:hypothetical protein